MNSSIVAIGINYGTPEMSERFVRSIRSTPKPVSQEVRTVLVDNTESDNSTALFDSLKKIDPNILTLKPPKNMGYFNGGDFGYQEYLKTGQDFSWVIVSNVDLYFDESFFTTLAEIDYRQRNIGVLGPSIWSSHLHCDLNPHYRLRPSAQRMQRYKLLYRNHYILNAYLLASKAKYFVHFLRRRITASANKLAQTPSSTSKEAETIYAPHGSLIAFSKLFFEAGGTLSFPSFLFEEELFVAETARRLNLKVVYEPSVRAFHDDHSSTGVFRSAQSARYSYESAVFIADTYFKT